jgi:DNA adenine methylase
MVGYICELCGKNFKQKSHYNSHKNRKTLCFNTNQITKIVDRTFVEKLKQTNNNKLTNTKLIIKTNKVNMHQILEHQFPTPFFKIVGCKTPIIDIINKFPTEIINYHELFLGDGSTLFALLSLRKLNKIIIKNNIYVYDLNEPLITLYKHIQNNINELYDYIDLYFTEYNNIKSCIINRNPTSIEEAKTSKESYYYWIRNKYNNIDKNTVVCSALFMFINQTSFRGMHREGPKGYNVPYGHYKKTPTIITKPKLDYISYLIRDVIFIHCDFSLSIKNVKKGDFVYLDPPNAPENDKLFIDCIPQNFNFKTHIRLFTEIKKLDKIKFVMRNAKVHFVTSFFKDYLSEDIIPNKHGDVEILIYN